MNVITLVDESAFPRNGSNSKESCDTPLSQASTAPGTPATHFMLPENDFAFERLVSGDTIHESSTEEEEGSEDPEEEADDVPTEDVEWPPVMPMTNEAEAPRLCIALPPLKSDLGKWSRWAVQWEESNGNNCFLDTDTDDLESETELENDEFEPVPEEDSHDSMDELKYVFLEVDFDEQPRLCTGMPPLRSALGKWAQWAVQWEESNSNNNFLNAEDGDDFDELIKL